MAEDGPPAGAPPRDSARPLSEAPLSFSDGERRSAPLPQSPQGGLQEWVFRKTPVLKERPTMKESSANVTARTIGIDLSQETSTYVSLGAEGDLLGEGKFPDRGGD